MNSQPYPLGDETAADGSKTPSNTSRSRVGPFSGSRQSNSLRKDRRSGWGRFASGKSVSRRKRTMASSPRGVWLYTYADFMTLLLTFFVLIFSMSSMDSSVLARISMGASGLAFTLPSQDKAQIKRISHLETILKETGQLQHNLAEIKNLLLPVEEWPMEIPSQLRDTLAQVVETDEGVVLILSGDLLFLDGDSELNMSARRLLDTLVPVIQGVDFDINIRGFTAKGESMRKVESLYSLPLADRSQREHMLSAERALAVLRYVTAEASINERLSISGYGVDKPVYTSPGDEYKNRRVEILFKVKKRLGDFL